MILMDSIDLNGCYHLLSADSGSHEDILIVDSTGQCSVGETKLKPPVLHMIKKFSTRLS